MKNFLATLFAFAIVLLAACSGGDKKKVVVMSSGTISVSGDNPVTINLDPSMQHNEKELDLNGKKVSITVKSPSQTKTYELTDNGTYLLNLKTDTLVGNLVNYGSQGPPSSITADQLQHIIDSTNALLLGQNASDADGTYFLPPFAIKKISAGLSNTVVGPYNPKPSSVTEDASGKVPDVFKFNTNTQKRKDLDDLIKRMSN